MVQLRDRNEGVRAVEVPPDEPPILIMPGNGERAGPLPNGLGIAAYTRILAPAVPRDRYPRLSRDGLTMNPGEMGKDKPMVTEREFWWSPGAGAQSRFDLWTHRDSAGRSFG